MIDDLFAADTAAAARDRIARPPAPPPVESKFSIWRAATALPRGIDEALVQVAATGADVLGGLRYMRDATPEQRKQMDRQGAPIEAYSSAAGDELRKFGREFRPDPATAHAAEQVVYGFSRGAAKVVGGAVLGGPVGVAAAGIEEGVTQADELRMQGVDFNTRAQAGAVQGAGLALAALPVIGQTKLATAGLYAIGGPGGFVAQQALTREILQSAGYDKIGAQFDPFDPVGLAVSALLPAGFAAWGLRQQKLQRAAASLPDDPIVTEQVGGSTITAKRSEIARVRAAHDARNGIVDAQVTEVVDAPIPSRPSAIADAVRAYPTEAVDAARVVLLAERRAAANPGAPDNLRAMDQHEAALTRAEEQIAAGERVSVADVAPEPRGPAIEITESTDAGPGGQINGTLRASVGGTDGGRLDYTVYDGIPQISMIEVPDAMRRQGIGGELVRELQRRYPDTEIQWGMMTDDGAALRRSLPAVTEDIASIKAQQQELAGAIAKRDELLKVADEFQAIDQPTPAQRDAFSARVEPLNDLHDQITRLQSELDGVRDSKTIIATGDSSYATWHDQITAAVREIQDAAAAARKLTDAPTTTQAANPEAAAPARGAGDAPAAAAADAGRSADLQAAGLTGPAGSATEAITERGLTVALRYRLTEAVNLTTSHTNDLTSNPAFPPELQPRDRTRAASAEQISRIENQIRPELLGESVKASDGAPIVGPDAVVESGNARTIALRRAYESGKADAYRAWLADNAERFGLTRHQVEGMQQPVLVRERLGDVDRAEFARQANESAVAAMSPTEQAMSDARRITDLSGLVANDDGTINLAQSADFVRQFIQQAVSPTERGTMLQANGQLSQAGLGRLRNAVFAKAYGDGDLVSMLTESTDANVRNILAGMLRAAPEVAKLADLAEAGARQDADIAGPLVEAVRLFSQLRSEGRTVAQFLAQGNMFGDTLDPKIASMLEAVAADSRSPKRIAEMIGGMVDTVHALGDTRQMGMFGDAPTGADAVAGAAERAVMESRLSAVSDRVASLEMFQPSLVVRLDAEGRPVTLAQEMAAIRREAANGTDDSLGAVDAGLIRVAAECALSMGL